MLNYVLLHWFLYFKLEAVLKVLLYFYKQTILKKYTERNVLFTELIDTTVSQGCVGRDECDFWVINSKQFTIGKSLNR